MERYESIRNQQTEIISKNPAAIVITRSSRTESDGGWKTTITTLTSQTIRIYDKTRLVKIASVDEAGWTFKKTRKAIAVYNADILAESSGSLDKFTYNGKTYKVVDVTDITTQGYIVFKEIEIEELT